MIQYLKFAPALVLPLLAGCAHDVAPAPEAGATSSAYRAVGQEPGWLLEIQDENIVLKANYGEDVFEFSPKPEAQQGDGYLAYALTANGPNSEIRIYDEVCADVMSGMNYPNRVTIKLEEYMLDGCGGNSLDLLVGGEWVVEDLNGGGVIDMARTSLTFDEDGGLSGSGACNRYSASYQLTGEGLKVGPIAATKKACPPAIMDQEMLFFDILSNISNFMIQEDGSLLLTATDQRTILAQR